MFGADSDHDAVASRLLVQSHAKDLIALPDPERAEGLKRRRVLRRLARPGTGPLSRARLQRKGIDRKEVRRLRRNRLQALRRRAAKMSSNPAATSFGSAARAARLARNLRKTGTGAAAGWGKGR